MMKMYECGLIFVVLCGLMITRMKEDNEDDDKDDKDDDEECGGKELTMIKLLD